MNVSMVIAVLMIVIIVLLLVGLLIIYSFQKKQLQVESVYTKSTKGVDSDVSSRIYKNLIVFPLINRYTRSVYSVYEVYHPSDEKNVIALTVRTVMMVVVSAMALLALAVLINPSLFLLCTVALTVYILADQVVVVMVEKINSRLLRELDNFLELLQFNYLLTGSIEDALHDSIIGKNPLIEKHAAQILKIITSDSVDDDLVIYNSSVKNKFLRELLCICLTVQQFGDPEVDGQSAFLSNLRNLKYRIGDADIESAAISKSYAAFPVVCVVAPYAAYAIEQWAISQFSVLEPYFKGYYGIASTILTFAITFVVYIWIGRNRATDAIDYSDHAFLTTISEIHSIKRYLVSYYDANYGKQLQMQKLLKQVGSRLTPYTLVVKRALFSLIAFVLSFVIIAGVQVYTKHTITSSVTGNGGKSSAAGEEECVVMLMMIRGYTDFMLQQDLEQAYEADMQQSFPGYGSSAFSEYLTAKLGSFITEGGRIVLTREQAINVIMQYNSEYESSTKLYTAYLGSKDGLIREPDESMMKLAENQLTSLMEMAVSPDPLSLGIFKDNVIEDIVEAVVKYNNSYWRWYYVLVCLGISVVAFMIPYYWIISSKSMMQQQMENEVLQFQSLILILMPIKSMSAEVIMDWLLTFSEAFHAGLHRCSVNLSSNEQKAYEDLIEEEPYEPFRDIVRKLQMCDKVGVRKAFFNMDVSRKNFEAHVQQATATRRAKGIATSSLISYAPIWFVIIAYMVVPIAIEAFGQLSTTMYQINSV